MPCYQIQTCTCNLDLADIDIVEKALKAEGWTVYRASGSKTLTFSKGSVSGSLRNKKMEFSYSSGQRPDVDRIKRAVAKQAILAKAEQYAEDGWELKEDGDDYWLENNRGYGATVNA